MILEGIFGALALAGTYFGFKKKDPTINMGSCFFDRLITPLYTFMNEYRSNFGLSIDLIDEDSVILNTPNGKLYGIELLGSSTINNFFSKDGLDELFREYKKADDGFLFYVLHKQGKWQRQYIFSHNKFLIKSIANYYKIDLMSGLEIANAIHDLMLQNSYYIDSKQIKRSLQIKQEGDTQEPEFLSFKRLARGAVFKDLNEIDTITAFKNLNMKKSDIQKIFQMDFDGAIWFYFDLNQKRIMNYIDRLIQITKINGNKEPFVALKDKYEQGEQDLVLVNSVAYLKRYSAEQIGAIGTNYKVAFIPKELYRTDLIRKTPLKYRDTNFDFLVQDSFLENFISCVQKKNAKFPDFFGIDKNKGFINYSFSEENDNPHSCIIADSGSGKSVSKQKIMAQMIALDFKTGEAYNLGNNPGNVKIRDFDIGYSNEKLIALLRSNPKNSVAQIEASLFGFAYNVVALEEPNIDDKDSMEAYQADIQFATDFISVILSSQNAEPLEIKEAAAFKVLLEELYEKKEFQRYNILTIKNTHPELFKELLELGYGEATFLSDIKEEKYNFLKKPLLRDIVNKAGTESHNMQIKPEDRAAYASLAGKLNAVEKLKIFSTFDKVDLKEADVISMDLNNFKESSLFTPIFMAIFQKTYLRDREFALKCKRAGRPAPKLLYTVEEAKNFFRVAAFETMFEKVALEARKYNVHLCLIVQNAEHIPQGILKNIDTKMVLLTPDTKLKVIKEMEEAISLEDNAREALANTERYELCIIYKTGVAHIKFEISEEEMKVFSTNPNILQEESA